MKKYEANDLYLTKQSIQTLMAIKNSTEDAAIDETDPIKKKGMKMIHRMRLISGKHSIY